MNGYTYLVLIVLVVTVIMILVRLWSVNMRRYDQFTKRLAYHECGHVIALAGFIPEPYLIEAGLESPDNKTLGHGYAHYRVDKQDGYQRDYLRILMLVSLSGMVAERRINSLGQTVLMNCDHDLADWRCYAERYLWHSTNPVKYFLLKRQQLASLKVFFEANKTILDELAIFLIDKERLHTDEILPYLEKVVFTDGFERMSTKLPT